MKRAPGSTLHVGERVDALERRLRASIHRLAETFEEPAGLSVAAEWLLDNWYIVDTALRQVVEELPPRFVRQLPAAGDGPAPGEPRAIRLARAALAAGDGPVDAGHLRRAALGLRDAPPLSVGEVWALPALLRLAVLEDLADLAEAAARATSRGERDELGGRIGRAVIGLRTLATADWKQFFEDVSPVEAVLRTDPAGVYPGMDFETRDLYRKAVEELARAGGGEEVAVAREAVRRAGGEDAGTRRRHVGYHLVGAGLPALARSLGFRAPLRIRLRHGVEPAAGPAYFAAVGLLTAAALAVPLAYAASAGRGTAAGAAILTLLAVLALVPAATLAVSLVQFLVTLLVPPRLLPRMDFDLGIPEDARTLVAVPCLLTGRETIAELLHDLEINYLGNREGAISFALLTDFADAPCRGMPGDAELLEAAAAGIRRLNRRHARPGEPAPFLLLHRPRRWNPAEGCWMGWERKRGKLTELNRLLAGEGGSGLEVLAGAADRLRDARFVLTLDADTFLPSGAGARLAATLAHPLNRPDFDPATGRLSGYTVLQPRVEVHPASANRTLFSRLFAGDTGLDPYTRAVSDAYQDLLGVGIYAGKGIYDGAAFHRSLAGRAPDNALLSHDLFEGIHGRTALVSDVVLLEDFPPNYFVFSARQHRWVRGDWQLLPWLLPRVPAEEGGRLPNRLPALGRWMIADNLRRSLLAPSLLLLLLAGWTVLPGSPWLWTAASLGILALPVLLGGISLSWRFAQGAPWRTTLADAAESLRASGGRALAALCFLPHEAVLMADAVARTLARVCVTRRRLLEWTTAAHAAQRLGGRASAAWAWRRMIAAPAAALAAGTLVAWARPEALPAALPLLALWFFAPEAARQLARPAAPPQAAPSPAERLRLRRLARRTWHFFERFVGPEDHWLPPDNFQEDPGAVVAHRTSPTNAGLLLTSTLAAWDLGYLEADSLAARLRSTLETLANLAQPGRPTSVRGHVVNWIDTRTLAPLEPRYVSTVDSGNLAACLWVVARGCDDALREPLLRPAAREGLADTLAMVGEVAAALTAGSRGEAAAVTAALEGLRRGVETAPGDPLGWAARLRELRQRHLPELERCLVEHVETADPAPDPALLAELLDWTERLRHHVDVLVRTVELGLPWLDLLAAPPPRLFAGPAAAPGAREAWSALAATLAAAPSPRKVPDLCAEAAARLARLEAVAGAAAPQEAAAEAREWAARLREALDAGRRAATGLAADLRDLAARAEALVAGTDFAFLYDRERRLFRIGYDATAGQPDRNHYDLLASEARLTSFLAIAKGDVPESHWLHLGRPLTRIGGARSLLSWSGSMFEYLMAPLLMESPPQTTLHESCRAAVAGQIAFGRKHGIPWGISESGYHELDTHRFYRYRAFGVPGLGLKRDLGDRLVVAPYATLLALPVAPGAVLDNLEHLEASRLRGRYGLFEAVDFGPPGPGAARRPKVVHSYMAHHQGMILAALDNALRDGVLVRRFHADVRIAALEYLLYEEVARWAPILERWEAAPPAVPQHVPAADVTPWDIPLGDVPIQSHVLSNGRLSVLLTSGGGGGLRWRGQAMTRWHADPTLEPWGVWLYLQDLDSGELWSAAPQPAGGGPAQHQVRFAPHLVEYRTRRGGISAHLEIAVVPDEDLEIRRVHLVNESGRPRRLALTSYGEPALAPALDERRHPAFNKLFLESERIEEAGALLFRRRPRAAMEPGIFLAHAVAPPRPPGEPPDGWETSRARFLGRSGHRRAPAALAPGGSGLTGAAGATLDPIFALERRVELAAGEESDVAFLTAAGRSRDEVLASLGRYRSPAAFQAASDAACQHAALELAEAGLNAEEARLAQQLFAAVIEPRIRLRGDPQALLANRAGQPGLWKHAISGDRPILLVRLPTAEAAAFVRRLLAFHSWWRGRGVEIDLVLLDEVSSGYDQPVRDWLDREVARNGGDSWRNRPGGIFVLPALSLSAADRTLLEAAAAAVLDAAGGDLARQMGEIVEEIFRLPPFVPLPSAPLPAVPAPTPPLPRPSGLLADNGFGGFTPDGREYVVCLTAETPPPAPWINVVANPGFGFLVSESGGGFTWAVNSAENRLTPWRNDPVLDMPGEALYLRDEETAEVWTPTRLPAGEQGGSFEARHRPGATVFRHHGRGLLQELEVFVARDAPVKIAVLRLTDAWRRQRRITATYYAEWVLGTLRHVTTPHVVTGFDTASGTLLASCSYPSGAPDRTAFLAADREPHGFTCDRTEFLGWHGDRRRPAALDRIGLSNAAGPGLDPCAALQIHLDIPPGGKVEAWFLLGEGATREQAVELVTRYREAGAVEEARREVAAFWGDLLGAVEVHTPEREIDLLANGWLLYQALSCRMWGRSAVYQSSGAFGFRDQLQDAMALLHAAPGLTRAQILEAARHQFEAGDVLHWWHPPLDRGMRTRCSDDLLWLPWGVAEYLQATGDVTILDEEVPFLTGPELAPEEHERYGEFPPGGTSASLYEHCLRALDRGATAGSHGLPLIGAGDWNDGMNRVGAKGRGESVWLAWFLFDALARFAGIAEARGEAATAARLRDRAERLRRATEESAWDGAWYLRAWYDDGAPLGSARSQDCRIDLIAQAWSVLSGAGDPQRAAQAMDSAWQRLVRPEDHLALLLAPPFDKGRHDPGYIKAYPPGIRENGGQYSHAAVWAAWAFARLGDGDRAAAVLRAILPPYRTRTPEQAALYRVEPYVVPADVYGVPPHTGRGGWTWYTGTAGWTWRLIVEGILGVRRHGRALEIAPCLPRDWPGARVDVRFGTAVYRIVLENAGGAGHGVAAIELDGVPLADPRVPLDDDGRTHEVRVRLGAAERAEVTA